MTTNATTPTPQEQKEKAPPFYQGGNGEFPKAKASLDIQNIKCADV